MTYTVAVRSLCEFTAKQGDLDVRFTPTTTALEGMAGHALVASRRATGYQTEVPLSGQFESLRVRGRADGFDAERALLEEVKTFRGDLDAMPENRRALHWAQAKVYGALMCQQEGLAEITVALVYFNVGDLTETVLRERCSAADLQALFEDQCRRFSAWAAQEEAHRNARDAALAALRFPHDEFRPGQRALSEAVYRAASAGRCLMAQAPTGIGKTVGTVFPMLKACATQSLDKLFFLSAKTPGRGLALEALGLIQRSRPGLPLRVLELVARDKACEHPDKACHGDSCPLAQGFYDHLGAARSEAVVQPLLDQASVRRVALAHQVCPYYLAHELVRWSDVVVGDYNYYFDMNAMLHGLTVAQSWRVAVLVDEAHNLVERGRAMYSAELAWGVLAALKRTAPAEIKPSLSRLLRAWEALAADQAEAYAVYPLVPDELLFALQRIVTVMTEYVTEHPLIEPGMLGCYFDLLHFTRLQESLGDHSLFDLTLEQPEDGADPGSATSRAPAAGSVLRLRNVVPAPFLKQRFTDSHCTALFSATLSPPHYYTDLLGLPDATAWVDVDSPFTADQLRVAVVDDISTRFPDREGSLGPIVELMARQYEEAAGNYLAFFSSFDYLQQVAALFQGRHPGIPTWEQSRHMTEAERSGFLGRFTQEGRGIGFAVLGGAFAEGIDLPGRRLIGAFVATLGLPQVNPVNEQIKARMAKLFGAGHDYTYLYPGIQKVVQAAGRVIRTPSDRGVVYLIDDRFTRTKVQRLLPAWWTLARAQAAPQR